MPENVPSDDEILTTGCAALLERLGPRGYYRFIQLLVPGTGDYTAERQRRGNSPTIDEIFASVEARREAETAAAAPSSGG